jgi:hypothetical protein
VNKREPPVSLKWKANLTKCIIITVPNTLNKQQRSNGFDDTHFYDGTNDNVVGGHIDIVKENLNNC